MHDITDICVRLSDFALTGFLNTPTQCVGGNVFAIASCFYVKNFVCCRSISARCQLMRLVKYVITIIEKVLRKNRGVE
jgi:hypothetical protein